MENLYNYIVEKFIINQNNKKELKDVSNVEIDWKTDCIFKAASKSEIEKNKKQFKHIQDHNLSISKCFNKKTKNFIFASKLILAIIYKWDDAIKELQSNLILNYPTIKEKNILGYFYQIYVNPQKLEYFINSLKSHYEIDQTEEETKECLKHYLNLYSVKI